LREELAGTPHDFVLRTSEKQVVVRIRHFDDLAATRFAPNCSMFSYWIAIGRISFALMTISLPDFQDAWNQLNGPNCYATQSLRKMGLR
jgi:hypothetical protein